MSVYHLKGDSRQKYSHLECYFQWSGIEATFISVEDGFVRLCKRDLSYILSSKLSKTLII